VPGHCAIGAARSGRITAPPVDFGAARRDPQPGRAAAGPPRFAPASTLHHVAPSWGLHPISGSPPRRRAPPDPRPGPGLSLHQRRARCRAGIKVAAPAAHSLLCPISFSFLPVLTTGGRDKGGGGAPLGVPRDVPMVSLLLLCDFLVFFRFAIGFALPCRSSPFIVDTPEGRGCCCALQAAATVSSSILTLIELRG